MKKYLSFFIAALAAGTIVTSCTDVSGDGIDSVIWEGSTNPENTSYRNPVWEPSAEGATIINGASGYVLLGATTQWAPGLTYNGPILTSDNFMQWAKNTNDAFTEEGLPAGGARVTSIGGDWAKTFAGDKYWIFYNAEGSDAIFVAHSANSNGPFIEVGELALKTEGAARDPFFLVQGKNYYLYYSTDAGTWMQQINIGSQSVTDEDGNKHSEYVCKVTSAAPVQIATADFKNVSVLYYDKSNIFVFGEVGDEIRYAKADAIKGPYCDKAGASIAEGSKGELLVSASSTYVKPGNPMRAFLNEAEDYLYLAYNATEVGFETMKSGYARRPMFVSPFKMTEDLWIEGNVQPEKGWTAPRFE